MMFPHLRDSNFPDMSRWYGRNFLFLQHTRGRRDRNWAISKSQQSREEISRRDNLTSAFAMGTALTGNSIGGLMK
jgi:hypothetical protein